ncbi:copper resistance CopC family protein [Domibacillus epiphyticus]|uniref:CopC domain-containing protein n=1 Tax=Domibacillus epiphyticus TaxID=1714355 RepID=A0A1V2A3Q7_9BACI|nr:copper resistance CopC family protein [Domibacillus epiphyticus]OMP65631.1 hypothetical protein BTO28_16410 [Domibacillus epiphyticus]
MKKSLFVLFFFLSAFTSSVSAHTGLDSSSPSNGQTVTKDIQDITLEFETVIEEGSSLSLQAEGENEIPLEDIRLDGNTLSGVTPEPLENGNYTVNWEIIGEDGHLIDGEYKFTVSIVKTDEESIDPEIGVKETNPSPTAEESKVDQSPSKDEATKTSDSSFSPNTVLVIGILVLAAIIIMILLGRKGKK